MGMTLKEIEVYCREFLKENYGLKLTIPVRLNSRLFSTFGCFVHGDGWDRPIRLEFNKKFITKGEREDIIKVIIHECVHYALYMHRKPFYDCDKYFEDELIKHGAPSDEHIDFKIERNVRVYTCKCKEHIFLQLIYPKRCLRCKTDLKYVGKRRELVAI